MKKTLLASALILALGNLSTLQAEEVGISAEVSGMTKYLFRGYKLTNHFHIQGAIEADYQGFYAGFWGTTDQEVGSETNLYLGYGFDLNDSIALDIGVLQYRFDGIDEDYLEYHLGIDFGFASLTFYYDEFDNIYLEASTEFALSDQWSLGLHAGWEDSDESLYDVAISLHYAITDTLTASAFATKKQSGDSTVFFGLTAAF
ncbi:TorF family putative porin [Alkalimonas delamerensis]|uniref:TorF family putative porin n=1 Tax=Alkalimonas delamerensis TaxID=265981 RepID=A0ABT9GLP0_9GAMM|nr:TorF family putative porin [Alkalimonas delamerensis]MDP4527885.1 TorF family putative porin [Alkalimonas delamerensis]